jgi:hypothetical protein
MDYETVFNLFRIRYEIEEAAKYTIEIIELFNDKVIEFKDSLYYIDVREFTEDKRVDFYALEQTIRLLLKWIDLSSYEGNVPIGLIHNLGNHDYLDWFFIFFLMLEDIDLADKFGIRYTEFNRDIVNGILNHPQYVKDAQFNIDEIKGFRFNYWEEISKS